MDQDLPSVLRSAIEVAYDVDVLQPGRRTLFGYGDRVFGFSDFRQRLILEPQILS